MPTLQEIRKKIAEHRPETLDIGARRAAVALILRGRDEDVEVLMVRRAEHEKDPWSGDLGFPGGKVDPGDVSVKSAAERETLEETGIELKKGVYLGRLDDISGAYLPINVACFVYHLEDPAELRLNEEISCYWWVPLGRFFEPDRHRRVSFTYRERHRSRPVIDLVEPDAPFLWGITYRLIDQFFSLLDHPMPITREIES